MQEWPKDGPPLRVEGRQSLGGGYSTPSVAAGRIFGMSYRGDDEVVWALAEDGRQGAVGDAHSAALRKAAHAAGAARARPARRRWTATSLYALGLGGDLVCLRVEDGKIVWRKNLIDDFRPDHAPVALPRIAARSTATS